MFLIRLAFWLGLAVLLLPTDERQQARLYGTAVATVERVSTFCDRHAKVCSGSTEMWATFVKKAEFGARLAVDLVSNAGSKGEEAQPLVQPAAARGRSEARLSAPARNTLTPSDLAPVWRNPQRAGG